MPLQTANRQRESNLPGKGHPLSCKSPFFWWDVQISLYESNTIKNLYADTTTQKVITTHVYAKFINKINLTDVSM